MLADSKNPTLTHKEKLAYLEAGAKFSQILAQVEGQKRSDEKLKKATKTSDASMDEFFKRV
jgi:hypothetical protein